MKTNELYYPKKAEDYSEVELYRLLSGDKSNDYKSVVLSEIKSNNLVPSAEEGMKLLKALTSITMYNAMEKNNEKN